MTIHHRLSVVTLAVALCSTGGIAYGSSGTVTGKFWFYENEGNFCPNTRSPCTGAKYVQSQYQQYMPVADTIVLVFRASDFAILGQGSTDASGSYEVFWSSPDAGNVDILVSWTGLQKDYRFRVLDMSGNTLWWDTPTTTVADGSSTFMGLWAWGGPGFPEPYSNVYAGALRMWNNSLGQTNRMWAYFGIPTLAIRAESTGNTWADIYNNIVNISVGLAYSPQGAVMHEMGHVASLKASRDQFYQGSQAALGCFPTQTFPCPTQGWNLTSTEWASAGFEDAVVTHLADVALYLPSADQPHTCISSAACGNGTFNLETSPGSNNCGNNANRVPLNFMRYFWDNYDSISDYSGEDLSRGVWEVVDTIHAFDNGFDNRQKNEPFITGTWNLDTNKYDGRGPFDFFANWLTWGTNSAPQLVNNCGVVGTDVCETPVFPWDGDLGRIGCSHHVRGISRCVALAGSPRASIVGDGFRSRHDGPTSSHAADEGGGRHC